MREKIQRYYPPGVDVLTFAIMVGMIAYCLFYFGRLPDEIPIHFNMAGEADDWGGKNAIFAMILINIHVVVLCFVLNYFLIIKPEDKKESLAYVNIPFINKDKLTKEQVFLVKRNGARALAVTNLMISVLFATLYYSIVQAGLGNPTDIGTTVGVLLVLVLAPSFYYVRKTYTDVKGN
ncbi:DUF1648 domain-containing protein [Oceanobacillus sp. CAU 1775]